MDNLTHTLIGLIAGESVARSTRTREPGLPPDVRRGLFVALAAIGGNLPDLDLLYSYRGVPHDTQSKLSYVLQHRGYTHTLLGCLLLTALLYAGAEWWLRHRRLAVTRRDRLELLGMSTLGTFLHLGMDFLNSYGIHPFWPVQNGWFYGDSVFIVEPLYWAAAAPLVFVTRSILVRVVIALALLAGLILSVVSNLVPAVACVGFAAMLAVLLVIGWRASARTAAIASAVAMLAVTAAFIAGGHLAARRIDTVATADFPNDRLIDHVLAPGPMNPLCWDVLLLEVHGDRYAVRHGVLSNAPGLIAASRCPTMSGNASTTVPMTKVSVADSAGIHWFGQFEMSKHNWLRRTVTPPPSCASLAYLSRWSSSAQWVVGDLRFEGQRSGGMADIKVGPPSTGACPPVAPWTPPRTELLQ